MTLTPIGKMSSADPDFNGRAAQAAYDLVMKMDEDTARAFVEFVVSDVLEDEIEKNIVPLQRHLDRVAKARVKMISKAMVATVVKSNSPEAVEYVEALGRIKKDWVEREHPRARNGQFRTKVTTGALKHPLRDKTARAMGVKGTTHQSYQNLTPKEKAQYQEEYTQLANFLQAVQQSTGGHAEVFLHFRDKPGKGNRLAGQPKEYTEKVQGTKPDPRWLNPAEYSLIGIEARPTSLTVGGAAFGLTSALGASGPRAANLTNGLDRYEAAFPDFRDTWLAETDPKLSNAQTYNRIAAGSKLVGAVSTDPHVQIAARFGQFVGSHGPEAEKVIGPAARKTAYRYRGTSKTPDTELVAQYNAALRSTVTRDALEGRAQTPVQIAHARQLALRGDTTFEQRAGGRAAVYDYLKGKLPDRNLYELQLASGNTPPSEGVLIDANGKIVDQAIGYGDDHYLPFNLKKLKALRGGEYVRTRSVGGLTTEDIYTGLMAGARQVTVVSRSGTFTVTFAPDFKGGRRYNDKAKRMTRRYAQILDAVQSEQVTAKNVDPMVRNDFVRQVRAEFPGESPTVQRKMVEEKIKEYKSNPDLTEEDMRRIDRLTMAAVTSDPSRDAKQYKSLLTQKTLADKRYNFRLDGHGYKAAAAALQEQFPYYLTAHSIPEDERDLSDATKDKGYVEPGRNRPTAAQAGLFGTTVNPGQKFSASHADYQGLRVGRNNTPDGTGAAAETESGESTETDAEKVVRNIKRKREHNEAANELYKALKAQGIGPNLIASFPFLKDEESFGAKLGDADAGRELEKLVEVIESNPNLTPQAKSAIDRYKRAAGDVDAREFDPALSLKWSRAPFEFGGKAYRDNADPQIRAAEVRRINDRTSSVLFGGNLSSLTEKQMKEEVEALSDVYRVVQDHPELREDTPKGAELRKAVSETLLKQYDQAAITKLLKDPGKIEQRLEDVHRMRALLAKGGFTPQEVANHTGRAPESSRAANVMDDAVEHQTLIRRLGQQSEVIHARLDKLDRLTPGEQKLLELVEEADHNVFLFDKHPEQAPTMHELRQLRDRIASLDERAKEMRGPNGTLRDEDVD